MRDAWDHASHSSCRRPGRPAGCLPRAARTVEALEIEPHGTSPGPIPGPGIGPLVSSPRCRAEGVRCSTGSRYRRPARQEGCAHDQQPPLSIRHFGASPACRRQKTGTRAMSIRKAAESLRTWREVRLLNHSAGGMQTAPILFGWFTWRVRFASSATHPLPRKTPGPRFA
jgi:hypothetical protein